MLSPKPAAEPGNGVIELLDRRDGPVSAALGAASHVQPLFGDDVFGGPIRSAL
jgi:hypothetical protein